MSALTDRELDALDHLEGWCSCGAQGLPDGIHRLWGRHVLTEDIEDKPRMEQLIHKVVTRAIVGDRTDDER
jgi:hypothetical protein